jgi:hypothetical protein
MQNIRLCRSCGRSLNRGRSDESPRPSVNQRRCLVCLAIEGLSVEPLRTYGPKQRPVRECVCGCGREGAIVGRGMVGLCYQRARKGRG